MSGVREMLGVDPTAMRGIFSPAGTGSELSGRAVLSTYRGPFREKVLELMERGKVLPTGVADAARSGASPLDIGRAVQNHVAATSGAGGVAGQAAAEAGERSLGLVAGQAAHAAAPVASPSMGLYMQGALLDHSRRTGIPFDVAHGLFVGSPAAHGSVPAAGSIADDAAQAAARVADEAALAAGSAAGGRDLSAVLTEALEHMNRLDPATRTNVLAEAGARTLVEAPPQRALEVLDDALYRVLGNGSAPAAAADDAAAAAATAAAEAAAPVADDVMRAAPMVDDLAKIAPAVAKSMPAVAEVLPQVASAVGKLTPELVMAAHGARGVAAMENALVAAVKYL